MHFGVAIFPTQHTIDPATVGRSAEGLGFESIFFPEHTHIPASRETPYPIGGVLPREYAETFDPFVALATVAAVTERIRLATGICLLVERDPIITAKEVASLDVLSGGRVLFGVGAGWNLEEMANHGTDPERRFGVLRERVQAIRTIWSEDEASYAGEHVNFEKIWCWPKPAQRPHPPILIGGNGRGAPDRVLRYGDEWMPNAVGDRDKLCARISKLREHGREAGREIGVTIYGAPPKPEAIEAFEQAGATRMVFFLPSVAPDQARERLERLGELIAAHG